MKASILIAVAAFGVWLGASVSSAAGAPTFLAAAIGIIWGCISAFVIAALMINGEDD